MLPFPHRSAMESVTKPRLQDSTMKWPEQAETPRPKMRRTYPDRACSMTPGLESQRSLVEKSKHRPSGSWPLTEGLRYNILPHHFDLFTDPCFPADRTQSHAGRLSGTIAERADCR